ncbi:hypothetical protein [Haliangium sp.]|uniref:hypothetical protein n=1 Tax=Haliangium sp. TaxID=2663208 RepID=UPI003D0BE0F0
MAALADDGHASDPAELLAPCVEAATLSVEQAHGARLLGQHDGVTLAAASLDGEEAVLAVGAIEPAEPRACARLRVETSVAPVAGQLWPGAERAEAVVLGLGRCTPESCPSAVVVRDGSGSRAGAFLARACDRRVELARVRWFDAVDSLVLTCQQSTGAGYRESLHVLHMVGEALEPVLTVETGTGEVASQEEQETPGFCPRRPVGWVRLRELGARPLVRVFDPTRGEPGRDGAGHGLQVDYRFEPAARRFRQLGGGDMVAYDSRAWCSDGAK